MLICALSATLESPTFKKSAFCYYVILRNCGAIKIQSRELGNMLNLMSQSNYVYHLPYLRYYALKFQFVKSTFSQKIRRSRDLIFFISYSFFIANLIIQSKFRYPNFLESIGIKFGTNQYETFPSPNLFKIDFMPEIS